MIFILAVTLGFTALMLRSAIAIATVGVLVVVAFLLAALLSAQSVQFVPLLIALAGYNVGIAGGFAGMVTVQKIRTA